MEATPYKIPSRVEAIAALLELEGSGNAQMPARRGVQATVVLTREKDLVRIGSLIPTYESLALEVGAIESVVAGAAQQETRKKISYAELNGRGESYGERGQLHTSLYNDREQLAEAENLYRNENANYPKPYWIQELTTIINAIDPSKKSFPEALESIWGINCSFRIQEACRKMDQDKQRRLDFLLTDYPYLIGKPSQIQSEKEEITRIYDQAKPAITHAYTSLEAFQKRAKVLNAAVVQKYIPHCTVCEKQLSTVCNDIGEGSMKYPGMLTEKHLPNGEGAFFTNAIQPLHDLLISLRQAIAGDATTHIGILREKFAQQKVQAALAAATSDRAYLDNYKNKAVVGAFDASVGYNADSNGREGERAERDQTPVAITSKKSRWKFWQRLRGRE
ncbi:MAG: hypothetical protein WCG83_05445 [Candidatus Peregrinibacteria bacterium]